MLRWLPYSTLRVDSPKRAASVFHDLARSPLTARRQSSAMTILLAVNLNDIVATVAQSRTVPIVTTPAREIVMISATAARPMASAQRALSGLGIRELKAAISTGAVVQRNMDKLLESSNVP